VVRDDVLCLGVFAAGTLLIFASVGFFHSITITGRPEHIFLVVRLATTAVIALPVGVWLAFRADVLRRAGRIGVCAISVFLVALNVELVSMPFAIAALVASIWLLRRPRQPLASL